MRRLTAIVSGKVQQVGYRSRVLAAARTLDITGYVMNLPDGGVKINAEGDEVDLDRFLRSVKIKNTLIRVSDICTEYSEPKGCYDSFYKITGEGETDARLDTAANYLKELIVAVREGFSGVNSKLDTIIVGQTDLAERIEAGQEKLAERIEAGQEKLAERFEAGQEKLAERIEAGQEILAERFEVSLENVAERLEAGLANGLEAGQANLADKIEESGERIASEVHGLRSDLKERFDDRLVRIEGDVAEIKARMGD
jgi:acylphosphatase